MKYISIFLALTLLTGCASTSSVIQSENAFVSGNGVALYLEKRIEKWLQQFLDQLYTPMKLHWIRIELQ